ncbi:MAG: DUF2066 domain-containing protein [Henriciella sp.]|jgi:hypothetical protein
MIRIFLLAVIISLGFASTATAQSRDVYTVRGITVDERAGSVIEAQQRAFASAKYAGAKRLIERITLPEDRAASTGFVLDQAMADLLAAAVDVEEETAGAGRYRGRLAVVFNPTNVRRALSAAGIPYTDRQGPKAVLIPVSSTGNGIAWNMAWDDNSLGRLVPTVTSRAAGFSGSSDWEAVQVEVGLYDAQRAVLADLSGSAGRYRVTLYSVTPSGTRQIGATLSAATLNDAVKATSDVLDEDWKRASVVRDTGRTLIEATVLYTSLAEWNTLRGALARSPLVSNFQTQAVATDGAVVAFAFAGDGQRLRTDLRDRGVLIQMESIGWVLTSATSASQQN